MMRLRVLCMAMVAGALLPRSAAAQMRVSEMAARPSLYLEGFGNSLLFCCSANLELPVSDHLSVRVGAARDAFADSRYQSQSVLMTVNGLVGGHGLYLEMGAGLVRSTATEGIPGPWRVHPTVDIGLRQYSHGFIRRVTFTPPLQPFSGSRTGPPFSGGSLGLSIGLTF